MKDIVVRVARELIAQGKRPTGARLRSALGYGTPSRLMKTWEAHVMAGGEGNPVEVLRRLEELHSYAPPTDEDVIRAGELLMSKGYRVSGHLLRKQLNGRGTPAKLEKIWLAHIMVVPRPGMVEKLSGIENAVLSIESSGIERVMEAINDMRRFIGLKPVNCP